MSVVRSLVTAVAFLSASEALAATKIDLFFPVPVDGALAKEMQNLVARFNKETPEVTAAYTGTDDETDIKTRAAIKAGKAPAAVIMSANFITQYHIDDLVVAFDDLIRADNTTPDQFMSRVDGKIYGVPFHNSTRGSIQRSGPRCRPSASDLG